MAMPGSGPLAMSQISAELAGENNLAYYRGRTYYRGNTPVVISNSPAFSEFYGLALGPSLTYWPVGGYCKMRLIGDVQPATPTVSVIAATGRRNFAYGSAYNVESRLANFNIVCPGVGHKNFDDGFSEVGGGLNLGANGLPSSAVLRVSIQQDNIGGAVNLDWGITSGLSGRVANLAGLPNFCGSDLNDALQVWQFTPADFQIYSACQAYSAWGGDSDWAFQIGAWFAFNTNTPQYNGMTVTLTRIS